MKKLLTAMGAALAIAAAAPAAFNQAWAADAHVQLQSAPIDIHDVASLQAGARTFVNYCLNCHSASAVRYNSLKAIGLTEPQIKDNLLFSADKVGEMMATGLSRKDGKEIFGAPPPDLSVIARSRGADWLYTYLKGFYRDPSKLTGWNNTVFPSVAMPHVLWQLQGVRAVKEDKPAEGAAKSEGTEAGGHGAVKPVVFETVTPGTLTPIEYDVVVRDLVNYMVWMGEPHQVARKQIGFWVLSVLGVLILLTWLLKNAFWKDVK